MSDMFEKQVEMLMFAGKLGVRPNSYKLYDNGRYLGSFNSLQDAKVRGYELFEDMGEDEQIYCDLYVHENTAFTVITHEL